MRGYKRKETIECPVCYEDDNVKKLSCGHTICRKCSKSWLKTCKTCPMCRSVIKYRYPLPPKTPKPPSIKVPSNRSPKIKYNLNLNEYKKS